MGSSGMSRSLSGRSGGHFQVQEAQECHFGVFNACVRYDKTKKANIGKRRNVYTTNIDDTYVDHPTACTDHVPNSPYGGIDIPPDAFYQVHTLSSRHPPSPRPGNPSRPSFRPPSCLLKSISY